MKCSAIIGLTLFGAIAVPTAAVAQKLAVATYHYDNQRTGWNGNETKLTPANVGSPSFGVLAEVVLDDHVDAQPLVVPNQQIAAGPTPGAHQVVYVATEANTIYAISASNGAVLLIKALLAREPLAHSARVGKPRHADPHLGQALRPPADPARPAVHLGGWHRSATRIRA